MEEKYVKKFDTFTEDNNSEEMITESLIDENMSQETKTNLKNEDMIKKLPGVLIAGVKKCGTGALIEILKIHPQMAAPSYGKVEVSFWENSELYKKGIEYYRVSMYYKDNLSYTNNKIINQKSNHEPVSYQT